MQVQSDAFKLWSQEVMQNAHMSCICSYQHHIVIQRKSPKADQLEAFDWMVPLWNYDDSAGHGWPVKVKPVPGHPGVLYLEFNFSYSDVTPITISEWKTLSGMTFEWRSVSFQEKNFPKAKWSPALRAIVSSKEQSMLSLAASQAWWSLDVSTLQKVGKTLKYGISEDASLLDALFDMTKRATKKSDDNVMDMIARRLEDTPHELRGHRRSVQHR